MTEHDIAPYLAALLAGLAAGVFHFHALEAGTRAVLVEARAGRAALLKLARIAVTSGLLIGAALAGTGPLLSAALGIGIGRILILRRLGDQR